MKSFDFDLDQLFSFGNRTFIPLGEDRPVNELLTGIFQKKLKKESSGPVPGVWGTLGWADNSPFRLKGKIDHSVSGNFDEGGNSTLTAQQVEDLKAINPQLAGKMRVVRERFINFDRVKFKLPEEFDPNNLPQLRLTLFLQPNEGALVYYEHHRKGNFNDPDAFQEHILYERQADATRDRLSYRFPVEPKYVLVPVAGKPGIYRQSTEETGLSFTIKILTYEQAVATENTLFKEAVTALNGGQINLLMKGPLLQDLVGQSKYALLRFDPKAEDGSEVITASEDGTILHYGGRFVNVQANGEVNVTAKTLLLIHGTFVNTMKSYKDLLLRKGADHAQPSYLQHLLASGTFDQVLAFDHPTLSEDAGQNVQWLKTRMKQLGISFRGNPISVITTSRGALVGEYMASDPECGKLLPMKKVLMFSAANGCGYFTTGRMISAGLSFWKRSASGPAAKVVLALLQLSADYILKQPGAVLMTINHPKQVLESILASKPNNPNLVYKCIVSDWDNCLLGDTPWMKRAVNTALDAVIKVNLGAQNDWVIGCEQQQRVPQRSHALRAPSEYRKAMHGQYLRTNYTRDLQCRLIDDPHACIEAFFNPAV